MSHAGIHPDYLRWLREAQDQLLHDFEVQRLRAAGLGPDPETPKPQPKTVRGQVLAKRPLAQQKHIGGSSESQLLHDLED